MLTIYTYTKCNIMGYILSKRVNCKCFCKVWTNYSFTGISMCKIVKIQWQDEICPGTNTEMSDRDDINAVLSESLW